MHAPAKNLTKCARPFRLSLFNGGGGKPGTTYRELQTHVSTGPDFSDSFDLIDNVIGQEIDYGALFSYLFRRFGYPNAAWDDYKELACYRLTTPLPDMFMQIVPHVGNTSCISIMFYVEHSGWRAIHDYEDKPRKDREARMHAWIESRGLPQWMGEYLAIARRDFGEGIETWQQAFAYFCFYERCEGRKSGAEGTAAPSEQPCVAAEWLTWAEEVGAAYNAIEPKPDPNWQYRTESVQDWSDEDPLKAYALAAAVALNDLKTPVRVRDSAINALGRVDDPSRPLKEPAVAGFPSGALGNVAPNEFAQLHGLIMKLGKGNAKRGIAKVIKACAQ